MEHLEQLQISIRDGVGQVPEQLSDYCIINESVDIYISFQRKLFLQGGKINQNSEAEENLSLFEEKVVGI